MKTNLRQLTLAVVSAGMLALAGCGGGGGGDDTITMTGVAATGAPFVGATIEVSSSAGVVGTSDPVGDTGKFSFKLVKGARPPFVLKASRTNTDGAVESLVSVYSGSGSTGSANITPITNLIASRLSPSGDPLKLAAELAAAPTTIDASKITAKVTEVQQILAPILTATGTTASDPLTADFPTNGTGYDRLLDSVKITVTPSSATTTNIEIGVKQQLADNAAPITIQFNNATVLAAIPVMPTIDATTLVASGTSTLIAQYLAQLNACYALPVTTRVNSTVTNGLATGTAANVVATECRNVFFGNDPANFKANGKLVGRDNNNFGAFTSLFRTGATGLVFSQGTYEFTRQNGDIVVGWKARDAAGNESYDTDVVRKDTDGKLKAIGNLYDYSGGISAYHQLRKFITLNQSGFDYYSTGYSLNVDLSTGGAGIGGSIFDRVVVTTPRNTVIVLKPKTGNSNLNLVKFPGNVGGAEIVTGTNFIRLNSVYLDSANTGDPAVKDVSLFFADRSVFTDATIAAIPAQSVWKFDYYLASAPGTLAATQTYKTRSRAMTIEELKQKGLASLAPANIAGAQALAFPSGTINWNNAASLNFGWVVPSGALPPTAITAYGGINNVANSGFNDSSKVGSESRSGTIFCSKTGVGDNHCSGNSNSPYAAAVYGTGLQLQATDSAGRGFGSFFAAYQL